MEKLDLNEKKPKAITLDDALSKTGFGTFNVVLLIVSGGCLNSSFMETTSMMYIIPAGHCDLHLDLTLKGLLSSISFFGVIVSSYVWGYFSDTRGRRKVLINSLFTAGITGLISSFAPNAWLFILLRFINGLAIGGTVSSIHAYIGEFHDRIYRPKVISWIAVFISFANLIMAFLAWFILPMQWSFNIALLSIDFRPWRFLLLMYTIPTIFFAICICFLPETPKFLCAHGRKTETLAVLQRMYSMNRRKACDHFDIIDIIPEKQLTSVGNIGIFGSIWNQTAYLFKGKLLVPTMIICSMQFATRQVMIGITIWYPYILNKMSFYYTNNEEATDLCTALLAPDNLVNQSNIRLNSSSICNDHVKTDVFPVLIIMAVIHGLSLVIVGHIINKIGKKQLLIIVVAVTSTAGVAAQYVRGYNLFQIFIAIFRLSAVNIAIINTFAVDLFPTEVRGMALALSFIFGRFGAMTGSNLIIKLLYNYCNYAFYVFAANNLILVILCYILPTEKKPNIDQNESKDDAIRINEEQKLLETPLKETS